MIYELLMHMVHIWRRIKHNFPNHNPRVDLLAWVLLEKVVLISGRPPGEQLTYTSPHHDLPRSRRCERTERAETSDPMLYQWVAAACTSLQATSPFASTSSKPVTPFFS